MDAFAEYDRFDAVGLARLVEEGTVHPAELVLAAIARIEATDPAVNAVVARRFEEALSEAEAAEADDAPFRGVPILLKDLVVEEGEPVTFGSVFFRDFRGTETGEFPARIRRAGFIRLGRTNTPEFGLLPTTEPRLHGPTRNPWDPTRSAGGSSGGAAAAVAVGDVPFAQGSDGGGSIRIPASACGVFGLKPSRGRMPRRPPAASDLLSVEFGLSRTVRDSAAVLDALHGPTPGEAYRAKPPASSFLDATRRDPTPLRIAVTTVDFRGDPVAPDCRDAVVATAELLEELGHEVVDARPPIDGHRLAAAFLDVWASLAEDVFRIVLDAAAERPALRRARTLLGDPRTMRLLAAVDARRAGRPPFEPFTWTLARRSWRRTPADLHASLVELHRISQTTGDFLVDHDVLLSPVLGSPPLPLGAIDQEADWDSLTEQLFRYVAFTPPANFGGFPAMSVPLHRTRDGLPVGSHFLGRHGDEETLLALAAQLERARPWAESRPPLATP